MEQKLVKFLLLIVFAIVYFLFFNFIWNTFLRVESSLFVLLGSLVVFLLTALFALGTRNKILDITRQGS